MNPLAGLDIAVFTVIKCFHAKFYVLFCDVNLLKMRYRKLWWRWRSGRKRSMSLRILNENNNDNNNNNNNDDRLLLVHKSHAQNIE